jgi:hypothetical protein
MSNTNCLDGMSCPRCVSFGPFTIRAEATFTVTDDGTDDYSDVDWTDDANCVCCQCNFGGTVKDFKK